MGNDPFYIAVLNECPENQTAPLAQYPHATNCSLYVSCHYGKMTVKECENNLIYNPILGMCDFKQNTKCLICEDCLTTTTTALPTDCDPISVSQLPHESNCSLYYKCEAGKKSLQTCPDDLRFNPSVQVCDFSQNVKC